MVGANEQPKVEDPKADRNRRRIGISIGFAAVSLLLAGAVILNWYRQVVCDVRITKAELIGDRCHIRIEAQVREPRYFYTVQKKRISGDEARHAWMVGSSEGGSDHWRFERQESLNSRIPLADTSTLDWHVGVGSHHQLSLATRGRFSLGRVRGGSEDADIDYFLRVDQRQPEEY